MVSSPEGKPDEYHIVKTQYFLRKPNHSGANRNSIPRVAPKSLPKLVTSCPLRGSSTASIWSAYDGSTGLYGKSPNFRRWAGPRSVVGLQDLYVCLRYSPGFFSVERKSLELFKPCISQGHKVSLTEVFPDYILTQRCGLMDQFWQRYVGIRQGRRTTHTVHRHVSLFPAQMMLRPGHRSDYICRNGITHPTSVIFEASGQWICSFGGSCSVARSGR